MDHFADDIDKALFSDKTQDTLCRLIAEEILTTFESTARPADLSKYGIYVCLLSLWRMEQLFPG